MRKHRIAAARVGDKNTTIVTPHLDNTRENWERLAKQVARKEPAFYYLFEVSAVTGKKIGDPIAYWHVSEGFQHAEGWWVS